LSVFNAHGVKYLVVGYAVFFHAQPRVTRDLDLFKWANPENAKAAYSALAKFGIPLETVTVFDLVNPAKFFRFGREPVTVDILSGIDGVNFEEAWARRIEGILDPNSGLTAFFISRDDLIQSKFAAGRLRDLADIEAIRAVATIQNGGEPVQTTMKPSGDFAE